MIRFLIILLFWVCMLGVIDIDIRFRDGLHIHFKSWLMWLTGKYKKLPKPPERSIYDFVEESDANEVRGLMGPKEKP